MTRRPSPDRSEAADGAPADRQREAHRIGILETASPDEERLALWEIFKRRLAELGDFEKHDVGFEFRWAEGRRERLAGAAEELVRSNVAVLVTAGTPAVAAACQATRKIPIIMATGVGLGSQLLPSVHKLSDNITGISDLPPGVSSRRLQLLRGALAPGAPLAMLADSDNPSSPLAARETHDAAHALGIVVQEYWVAGPDKLADTVRDMARDGITGFVCAPGAMFFAARKHLAALALEHRLASMAVRREYAEAGCLLAYGSPIAENYRQAALYVSRILTGTSPADIPIGQPNVFEFVLNRATARTLALTLPETLLSQAEVVAQ